MAMVPSLFTPGRLFSPGVDPFLTLHREMNRLFDEVWRGAPGGDGSPGSRTNMLLAPHMDVSETDTEVRIQAELPGVEEKDVELSMDEDVLTLRAEKKQERKQEREGVHINERSFGTFQRSLRLPYRVNPEQVQARFENGVLTITLPKSTQQARSQRIPVQGAQGQSAQVPGAQSRPAVTAGSGGEGRQEQPRQADAAAPRQSGDGAEARA